MHSLNPEFNLPKLRRQLEEILALLSGTCNVDSQETNEAISLSVHPNESTISEEQSTHPQPEPDNAPTTKEAIPQNERDDLYDDALVVITEFGNASIPLLQMWLSVDYSRAKTVFDRFLDEGIISSNGKVRHKAFLLRSSANQQA